MRNSRVFSITTKLCIHQHYLIPKHFVNSKRNPLPINSHFLFLLPLALGNHQSGFYLYGFPSFGRFT